jgi:hypothetical protein
MATILKMPKVKRRKTPDEIEEAGAWYIVYVPEGAEDWE